MGDLRNSLRHLGMIGSSPSWRRWWVQIMIARWRRENPTRTDAPYSTQSARVALGYSADEKTAPERSA